MRSLLPFATALFIVFAFGLYVRSAPGRELVQRQQEWGQAIRAGDLVFQDLECGERCALIRQLTQSPYSHVGIVLESDGELMVWEAYAPVGPTPLAQWVRRGREHRVAVARARASLQVNQQAVADAVRTYAGRPYDGDYQWDDERIYCSELIAKAYRRALGRDLWTPHTIEMGSLAQRVAHLSDGRLTPRTLMVTPVDLIESSAFTTVIDELRIARAR